MASTPLPDSRDAILTKHPQSPPPTLPPLLSLLPLLLPLLLLCLPLSPCFPPFPLLSPCTFLFYLFHPLCHLPPTSLLLFFLPLSRFPLSNPPPSCSLPSAVLKAVKSFPVDIAPGPSGLRANHLKEGVLPISQQGSIYFSASVPACHPPKLWLMPSFSCHPPLWSYTPSFSQKVWGPPPHCHW